ncbi:ABC transporter permease [Nonomuraea sp. K274]|uniref:ABC transporter permease n=1 Tax=Nonomuraea cypriaca TaxID=1187855 RepID=A0A931AKD3_9ACTN|nr:ABC transporter permease [Nonomuraea cypriaca]MBF8190637.1 ABC transporter permease [Nonomuraea cypriaca]
MPLFILKRLRDSVIALVLATVLVFLGVRALPGDIATAMAGEEGSPEQLAAIRDRFGLDEPVYVQYFHWISNMARGDMGASIRTGQPVSDLLSTALPATAELAVLSLVLALLIGIPLGAMAAVRRGRAVDHVSNGFSLVGLSIPNFWFGLVLILILSIGLGWLPSSGYRSFAEDPGANLLRMVMPAMVLGIGVAAVLARQMQASMIESLSTDYVRTARAKGLREPSVIVGHALRNSLITAVTIIGLQLGALISGAAVTEKIFVIPGLGKLAVDSVFQRDYPVIQGVVLVSAAGYIIVNFAVDALYSVLNPRIRVAGGAR